MSTGWLDAYEEAVELRDSIKHKIQERNSKFPNGGPEASRITAGARRQLGTLKTQIDMLHAALESGEESENEKNRRRNQLMALLNERDAMIQGLKRNAAVHKQAQVNMTVPARVGETDATAEANNAQLLVMQKALMEEQDVALDHLEKSVVTTKHIALQINEETQLQNRLLDDMDEEVDQTSNRLALAQKKLTRVMRQAGGCKAQILLLVTILILVCVLILGFKILI